MRHAALALFLAGCGAPTDTAPDVWEVWGILGDCQTSDLTDEYWTDVMVGGDGLEGSVVTIYEGDEEVGTATLAACGTDAYTGSNVYIGSGGRTPECPDTTAYVVKSADGSQCVYHGTAPSTLLGCTQMAIPPTWPNC